VRTPTMLRRVGWVQRGVQAGRGEPADGLRRPGSSGDVTPEMDCLRAITVHGTNEGSDEQPRPIRPSDCGQRALRLLLSLVHSLRSSANDSLSN
jgi:hypothetical protein